MGGIAIGIAIDLAPNPEQRSLGKQHPTARGSFSISEEAAAAAAATAPPAAVAGTGVSNIQVGIA